MCELTYSMVPELLATGSQALIHHGEFVPIWTNTVWPHDYTSTVLHHQAASYYNEKHRREKQQYLVNQSLPSLRCRLYPMRWQDANPKGWLERYFIALISGVHLDRID